VRRILLPRAWPWCFPFGHLNRPQRSLDVRRSYRIGSTTLTKAIISPEGHRSCDCVAPPSLRCLRVGNSWTERRR
jgi:hypothetical protein